MTQALQGDTHPGMYLPGDPETWTPGMVDRHARMLQFMDALRQLGTYTDACRATDIDNATVWRWRNDYPAFRDAVTTFMTRDRQVAIEDNMYRIATSTDPKTANATVKAGELYLKALDRDKWGDKLTTDTTITINTQVQHVIEVREKLRAAQSEKLHRIRTLDEVKEPE